VRPAPPLAGARRVLSALGVAASIVAWSACDDGDPVYGVAGGGGASATGDTILTIALGDGQSGRTSETLSEPLVVQATVDLGLDEGVPVT